MAAFGNLPTGKYRFRVDAYEISNPTTVSEAAIEVQQRPYFYGTPWFLLGCLCVVLLIVLAIHRYRLRQVASRFEAVIEERTRMAREMHDTVIQDCIGLSTLLEAVSSLDFTLTSIIY
jgi:signal transduction histidine kinase